MKIKEHFWEIIRQLFKWRTGQPTDPEEIKRRIKDLEKMNDALLKEVKKCIADDARNHSRSRQRAVVTRTAVA